MKCYTISYYTPLPQSRAKRREDTEIEKKRTQMKCQAFVMYGLLLGERFSSNGSSRNGILTIRIHEVLYLSHEAIEMIIIGKK